MKKRKFAQLYCLKVANADVNSEAAWRSLIAKLSFMEFQSNQIDEHKLRLVFSKRGPSDTKTVPKFPVKELALEPAVGTAGRTSVTTLKGFEHTGIRVGVPFVIT